MRAIKNISYNCQKATFLIEKKQITRISLREKIELSIHLAGCSICKIFQQQSILINKIVGKHFTDQYANMVLDENFKHQLQQKVNEHLNKARPL